MYSLTFLLRSFHMVLLIEKTLIGCYARNATRDGAAREQIQLFSNSVDSVL